MSQNRAIIRLATAAKQLSMKLRYLLLMWHAGAGDDGGR